SMRRPATSGNAALPWSTVNDTSRRADTMTVTTIDAGPNQVSRAVEVQAPAAELFAIVADPRRHHEVAHGSGTVGDNINAPERLIPGARFSTKMKMFGLPYRIT